MQGARVQTGVLCTPPMYMAFDVLQVRRQDVRVLPLTRRPRSHSQNPRSVFADEGYTVRGAVDGAAALESLVEDRPDLVLLDIDMPRLRGAETLIAIRELSPETKVIMIRWR